MKKGLLVMALISCIFALSACSSTKSPNLSTEENTEKQGLADTEEKGGATNLQEGTGDSGNVKGEGYIFEVNGTEIAPDMLSDDFLPALGEPLHYYEAKSCAFEGMDKIYTYASFEITTYPKEDKDYVSSIVLKDDLISTKEGIRLYMGKEEVINVYGEDYTERKGAFIYAKGGMELRFIFNDDNECISIEYASCVLNEE